MTYINSEAYKYFMAQVDINLYSAGCKAFEAIADDTNIDLYDHIEKIAEDIITYDRWFSLTTDDNSIDMTLDDDTCYYILTEAYDIDTANRWLAEINGDTEVAVA